MERNPADSLVAARNGLRLAFKAGRWEDVLRFWEAVQDAGQARLRAQFEREDKIATLGQTRGLSALAAWAAGQQGDLPRAVEILESGRAQLLREAQERQRRDLHALAGGEYDALYQAYRAAARQVDDLYALPYARRPADWGQQLAAAQGTLQQATDALRDQAPGFKYFLRPLPFEAIREQAADAPLVYLAATDRGGFALVVPPQTAEAWHIPLPQLTDKSLRERVQGPDDDPAWGGYLGAYLRWRNDPGDETARAAWFTAPEETLDWLGKAVMRPLVTALQEKGLPQGALVRLAPGGWLGLLPLHAGRWTMDGGRETVDGEAPSTVHGQPSTFALDHYTFTYAPSAQALYHTREDASRPADSLLAVRYPDPNFQLADQAVAAALDVFPPERTIPLLMEKATLGAVRQAFAQHAVLFFFTHGFADFNQPLNSGLLTADEQRFTLDEILSLRSQRARLAVLSACETGVPSDVRNVDEVVSLPSGMMQAGIPGVVGSLWSVAESSTAILMSIFFEEWRTHGLTPP
ncbi:CHAT domain-containing protein [Chloroflexus aggregans]|uniref:CHAT domain-containing protein n=1 Tax=Chloroflexus aggregans (strain MD-66 / DSM 9485) TaxID=326427 RepID=B8G4Z1_CHLAD|nr:CHAT domain-containing protein [Chloroflexus aggregans]ACL23624.1 conserved hypothetical protein [Chloroflexus aggregans DSM 9485]